MAISDREQTRVGNSAPVIPKNGAFSVDLQPQLLFNAILAVTKNGKLLHGKQKEERKKTKLCLQSTVG